MKTFKILAFTLVALVALTSCDPIDDYITTAEFSDSMRTLEQKYSDQYEKEDFKRLRDMVI